MAVVVAFIYAGFVIVVVVVEVANFWPVGLTRDFCNIFVVVVAESVRRLSNVCCTPNSLLSRDCCPSRKGVLLYSFKLCVDP